MYNIKIYAELNRLCVHSSETAHCATTHSLAHFSNSFDKLTVATSRTVHYSGNIAGDTHDMSDHHMLTMCSWWQWYFACYSATATVALVMHTQTDATCTGMHWCTHFLVPHPVLQVAQELQGVNRQSATNMPPLPNLGLTSRWVTQHNNSRTHTHFYMVHQMVWPNHHHSMSLSTTKLLCTLCLYWISLLKNPCRQESIKLHVLITEIWSLPLNIHKHNVSHLQ